MTQTADTSWKHDLVYSTPGVIDPKFVLSMLDRIDDQDEARAFVARHVPTFPEPADLPLPSWATDGSSWTWDDQQWSRVLGAPHILPSGGGFTVETLECVLADGTVIRDCPVLDVNLPVTDIMPIDEATHLSRLAALAATTLLTARSVWKDELVAWTPGLFDPLTTRAVLERIDDPERAELLVSQGVPTIPKPSVIAPGWADEVGEWKWLGGADQKWARRSSKELVIPDADGQGISLSCWQYADADGVTTDVPGVDIDIEAEEVPNLRELAAWFAAAAETVEAGAA